MRLTEDEKRYIEESITHYPEKKSAVMDALRIIQEKYRYIPSELLPELSEMLEMPAKDIEGVISFYTMYTTKPRGKHHIQVCTNVSCKVMGGDDTLKAVTEKLGIGHNETDTDGIFSVEEVECMGACGGAPMIAVNDKYYERFDKIKTLQIIEDLKDS